MTPELYASVKRARVALDHGERTLVVIRGEQMLYHSAERGLGPLVRLLDEDPEILIDSVIGDRLVGRASAFLCLCARAQAVFGMAMSDEALTILTAGGCTPTWREVVPYIAARDMVSRHAADAMLKDVDDPQVALAMIREYISGADRA